jgi:hypothetical protein
VIVAETEVAEKPVAGLPVAVMLEKVANVADVE